MMKNLKTTLLLNFLILCVFNSGAKEGMWLPMFLQQLNEAEMQAMGLELSAEDIYSINNGSLKDAIVHFGGGCTAEIISSEGLLLTNHQQMYSKVLVTEELLQFHKVLQEFISKLVSGKI